jgi:hypothetical protein
MIHLIAQNPEAFSAGGGVFLLLALGVGFLTRS